MFLLRVITHDWPDLYVTRYDKADDLCAVASIDTAAYPGYSFTCVVRRDPTRSFSWRIGSCLWHVSMRTLVQSPLDKGLVCKTR